MSEGNTDQQYKMATQTVIIFMQHFVYLCKEPSETQTLCRRLNKMMHTSGRMESFLFYAKTDGKKDFF